MRQLQITPKGQLISAAIEHNLGILTSVEQLARFDMIYIYHHLSIGAELTLQRDRTNPYTPCRVEVFFKGFKLGHVSEKTSAVISRLMDKGCLVKAKVKGLRKQKYMPLSGLDIDIRTQLE